MQGSLGEKIGEGAFSEAYAWAPGQVVKLFKPGVSHLLGRHEARMIRAVRAAGVPAPDVFGEVTLDGRFGILLERLDGPTLWHLSRTGAVTFEQAGAIVAALAMSVHKTPPPPEVLSMREYMEDSLRLSTMGRFRSTSPRIFSRWSIACRPATGSAIATSAPATSS